MCWLIAGNETLLEAGWEGRETCPGDQGQLCHLVHHSHRPSSGLAKHLPVPQGCRGEGLQQTGFCFPLDQSGGLWVGQLKRPAHLPSLPATSISLPSALTGLASHPMSPMWGGAGKGVIRSCPPLQLFPLPHPPSKLHPPTQACCPPSKQ